MDAYGMAVAIGVGIVVSIVWKKVINPLLDAWEKKRRDELRSIFIDPTSKSGPVLTVRRGRKGKSRYYRNGWRVSKKTYDREFAAIIRRMNARDEEDRESRAIG